MSTIAQARRAEGELLHRAHQAGDALNAVAGDELNAALDALGQAATGVVSRLELARRLMASYVEKATSALERLSDALGADLGAPPPPEAQAEARRDELVASRLEQLAASDRERHAGGGRTARVGALVVLEEGASEPGTLSRASADTAKAIAPERGPSAVVVADDPEADLAHVPPPLAPERIARALDAPPAAGEMSDKELNALATRVSWPQPVAEPAPAANGKAKGRAKAKRRKK